MELLPTGHRRIVQHPSRRRLMVLATVYRRQVHYADMMSSIRTRAALPVGHLTTHSLSMATCLLLVVQSA